MSNVVIDSLAAGSYDVSVSDMSGCGGAYNYIELTSPPALKVTTVPQELAELSKIHKPPEGSVFSHPSDSRQPGSTPFYGHRTYGFVGTNA